MIFELAQDFHDTVLAMPEEHPRHRILELLEEAIRRDVHFIARHPTTLFQCMWNTCWWYDCPEAAKHYEEPKGGWPTGNDVPPWGSPAKKVCSLLEHWRHTKEDCFPNFVWIRSVRAPIWSLGSTCRTVFRGHEGGVSCIAISANGQYVVSGCASGTTLLSEGDWAVRIWDAYQGVQIASCNHSKGVQAVLFVGDGDRLLTGANDGVVRLFDGMGEIELCSLSLHRGPVTSLAVSADGKHGASAGSDGRICLWDITTSTFKWRSDAHDGIIRGVAFSPDGSKCASWSDDGMIRIWAVDSGCQLFRINVRSEPLTAAFVEHGRQIAAVLSDGYTILHEIATERTSVISKLPWRPDCATFAQNLKHVAITCRDVAFIWDTYRAETIAKFVGHEEKINNVLFYPDESAILSCSEDGTIRNWILNRKEIRSSKSSHRHSDNVAMMQLLPNGLGVLSATFEGEVLLWDLTDGVLRQSSIGNILARTPAYGANSLRCMQYVTEMALELTHSSLPIAWYQGRIDILFPHPFGNLFVGARGRDVYILELVGERVYHSRLDDPQKCILERELRCMLDRLATARQTGNYRDFFHICEPLIEVCLALEKMTFVGEICEECADLMIRQGDSSNAMFFYRQAEQVWQREQNQVLLTRNRAAQHALQSTGTNKPKDI